LEIIALFDDFTVHHVSRDENTLTNILAQQASGFRSNLGKFNFLEKNGCSGLPNRTVQFLADTFALSSAKPDVLVFESRGSEFPGSRMKQVK
jgi:hypothetical protein